MTPFGPRLHAALADRGRMCVGIDPHPGLLAAWGLPDDVTGLERFARDAVAVLGPLSPVLKPQAAFFERFGSAGVAVLARTLADVRATGALALLDAKRGDIGSTSAAYADGLLDPASDLAGDAVTLSPYLGLGSLDPFVTAARAHGGGLFVLALTSNPEGAAVQHARSEDGRSVAQGVLEGLRALNREEGAGPLGSFGAVVGATATLPDGTDASLLDIGGPLLLPGVGAQGAGVDDVRRLVGEAAPAALPSTSREVLGAGPDPAALADACRAAQAQAAVLGGP
ncbi:orotidine-5'-phosphate decarboxylase [uncultured Nocardioides sp.]|uniref:orotidine-5'-phosphate decarboxylase n=1 Tax=uncultured Nocardioides sp. TaxID=198441 RepID=UPI0026395A95|nr:orotidine-5'-phosphate decarboxylase [uncultured Nocardioides sp.]